MYGKKVFCLLWILSLLCISILSACKTSDDTSDTSGTASERGPLMAEKAMYGADGSTWSRVTYTYDAAGNLTEETEYDDVMGDYRYTYTYDEAGNLTEMVRFDVGRSLSDRVTYTYDAAGNLTEPNRGNQVHRQRGGGGAHRLDLRRKRQQDDGSP